MTYTPGTLEEKPVGGDFSLRAFNVVRCLAQAEFRSEIDRCKDEAEYLMLTLRGEKQADYLRVHFPEISEIASLRARVEGLRTALQPFAELADEIERASWQHQCPPDEIRRTAKWEHCLAARQALDTPDAE